MGPISDSMPFLQNIKTSFQYNHYANTVRRKSIRPFADFSSKMAIFKVSEKYLNDGNLSKILQFLLLIIEKAFWFDFGAIIFSGSENASF